MTTPSEPDSGWYDDPTDPGRLRWWDGTEWGDHTKQRPKTKSAATRAVVLGVASLLPGWGFLFGPLGVWLGRREIREITEGVRDPSTRRRAVIGRNLSVTGIAISLLVAVAVGVLLPRADELPPWFAANQVTFTYPSGWSEMDLPAFPGAGFDHAVSPRNPSGNWMRFIWIGPTVAADAFGPVDGRIERLVDQPIELGPGLDVTDLKSVEVAGYEAVMFDVDGMVGARTGTQLAARAVVVLADEDAYFLMVQYEAEMEETMLTAWEDMIADLRLP